MIPHLRRRWCCQYLKKLSFLQCISVFEFRPAMKNHELQTYSFFNVYIHFKVHIFLTTTTILSLLYLTLLNSQLFPLQSHCGCTSKSKETKPRLFKANDNAIQEFSRSINSQQRPSPVSLPTMFKPRLASPCLLGFCNWLYECQYQEKQTLTTCCKQHALMAYGHFFAFSFLY